MYIKKRKTTSNIIIVSTGTEPDTDLTAYDIDRIHRDKGCAKIGFHYIIRRDGMVETGRELERRGNYKRKYNKNSVYVCLVGSDGNFTPEQLEVLPEIEEELHELFPSAELIDMT